MRTLHPHIIFLSAIIGIIIVSCASQGSLTGGDKDENPPLILLSEPENFSTNITDTKINIQFDEYFQLKNINDQLIISPPLDEEPDIKIRGKELQIDLNNSLLENTTYTLNFGNAIVDLNEGNILNNYLFAFSTGDKIDSLLIKGNVQHAYEGKPVEDVFVMLYKDFSDSVPIKQIPIYISKTDKNGKFSINNIHEGSYKMFALKETNVNYLFDNPTNESIAFLDSLIIPYAEVTISQDTISKDTISQDSIVLDSIVSISKTKFYPDNINLFLFEEDRKEQYLSSFERPVREKCCFIFNRILLDSLEIRILNSNIGDSRYYLEREPSNDTIYYWIRDSIVNNIDSLMFELSYIVDYENGEPVNKMDTVNLFFRGIKTEKPIENEEFLLKMNSDRINPSGTDPGKDIILNFSQPVNIIDTARIQYYEIVDSIETVLTYKIENQKPGFFRKFNLPIKTEAGKNYKIIIEPKAFYDIYDNYNDSLIISFKTRNEDYYGSLVFNITGINSPGFLELIKNKTDVFRSIDVIDNGDYKFARLDPGSYLIRYIFDTNENGKWDTGDYLKNIQPERILYYNMEEIKVKSNWEIKENWAISEL